jgi:hypothetical protein
LGYIILSIVSILVTETDSETRSLLESQKGAEISFLAFVNVGPLLETNCVCIKQCAYGEVSTCVDPEVSPVEYSKRLRVNSQRPDLFPRPRNLPDFNISPLRFDHDKRAAHISNPALPYPFISDVRQLSGVGYGGPENLLHIPEQSFINLPSENKIQSIAWRIPLDYCLPVPRNETNTG